MAHEITASDRFGEVRAGGKRAWHGLGIEISPGLTAAEGFIEIGLDWPTEMLPLYACVGNRWTEMPGVRAHIRTDTQTMLGVVSDHYKPFPNRSLAEFADSLAGADKAVRLETAGSLRGGRRVFALVRLPSDLEVTKADVLRRYVAITNAHDGTGSFACYPTDVRIVCANTLRMSESSLSKGVSFRHTGDIQEKIAIARRTLGIVLSAAEERADAIRALQATALTQAEAARYFRETYTLTFGTLPDDDDTSERAIETRDHFNRIVGEWLDRLSNERNAELVGRTAWAAYNAVSEWNDHGRGRFKPVAESDGRVHSNLFGVSARHKEVAFSHALTLVT